MTMLDVATLNAIGRRLRLEYDREAKGDVPDSLRNIALRLDSARPTGPSGPAHGSPGAPCRSLGRSPARPGLTEAA